MSELRMVSVKSKVGAILIGFLVLAILVVVLYAVFDESFQIDHPYAEDLVSARFKEIPNEQRLVSITPRNGYFVVTDSNLESTVGERWPAFGGDVKEWRGDTMEIWHSYPPSSPREPLVYVEIPVSLRGTWDGWAKGYLELDALVAYNFGDIDMKVRSEEVRVSIFPEMWHSKGFTGRFIRLVVFVLALSLALLAVTLWMKE